MLELFQANPIAWVAVVFFLSLLVGSFLNVVIHRVPIMLDREWKAQAEQILRGDDEPVVSGGKSASEPTAYSLQPTAAATYNLLVPRSACPKCGATITAAQNVPVLSWLLLKGKCAKCGAKISARYPIVELSTAILSAVVAWKFGVTWYTGAALLLTWALIALSVIDFDTQLLPDNITLPLIWTGLLVSLAPAITELGLPVDPRSSILGAAAGYLSLWSVFHVFKLVTGKEGMGYGDFKLFAALGAWLGWQMLPLVLLFSAFTGAVVGIALIVVRGRDRNVPIAFGPFLAGAGLLCLVLGPAEVRHMVPFAFPFG